MRRLIVKYKESNSECFVNIPANNIVERENQIFVYQDEALVGVFDLGFINALYISEK